MDPRRQDGLINKRWTAEIQYYTEQMDVLKTILNQRQQCLFMDEKSLKHYIGEISYLLKDYAKKVKLDADYNTLYYCLS